MPVPVGVRDARCVGRNLLRTHATRFGEQTHVAVDAVRSIRLNHVSMTAQLLVTFETAEMMQMPIMFLGACVFASEYQLIATVTSREHGVGKVTAAEVLAISIEVEHIDK